MKPLIAVLLFLSFGVAQAQNEMVPLPRIILLSSTNGSAPFSVVMPSTDSVRQNFAKQQSVVKNLQLVCMIVGSVAAEKKGHSVSVTLHEVTAYAGILKGESGGDLKLRTAKIERYVFSLDKGDLVQVNNELLTPDSFWKRFGFKAESGEDD